MSNLYPMMMPDTAQVGMRSGFGQRRRDHRHTHRPPVASAGLLLLIKHVHVDDLIKRQADDAVARARAVTGLKGLDG